MWASRILRLARTSRCAIVASATRNARAISAVVRPPSARRVSATRASGDEGRVAAGEDQPQAVVGELLALHGLLLCLRPQPLEAGEDLGLHLERALAAQPVDRAVAGDPGDPGARVVGQPVARPSFERNHEGVLNRLLGEVEVAEDADQARDRPPRLASEQAVERPFTNRYDAEAPCATGSSMPAAS